MPDNKKIGENREDTMICENRDLPEEQIVRKFGVGGAALNHALPSALNAATLVKHYLNFKK